MCGKKQEKTYVWPTVIKQERTTALNLVRNDLDDGGGMGLIFDETAGSRAAEQGRARNEGHTSINHDEVFRCTVQWRRGM